MGTCIRWALVSDLPEIEALDREGYSRAWPRELWEAYLEDNSTLVLVAGVSSHIQGCAAVRLRRTRCDLVRLAVGPRWRRQGVGRHLLAWLGRKLDLYGKHSARVLVPETNLGAQLFLRSCGYVALRIAPGADGESQYVFRYVAGVASPTGKEGS